MRYRFRLPTFFIVTFLYWSAVYTCMPVLTPHAESLNASLQMVGLIGGAYGLMQLLLRLPLGILSDKLGRRRIFVTVGILFGTLSAVTLLLGKSPGWVLLARVLAGISACAYVQLTVLYASYFTSGATSRSISMVSAGSSASQVLAMMAGGALADRFGVDGTFAAGSAVGLMGIIFSLFLYEPVIKKQPLSFPDVVRVARTPGLIAVSLLSVLTQAIFFGKVFSFAPVASSSMDATGWQLGIVSTLASMGSFFSAMLAGAGLISRLGERRLILCGFALHFIGSAMMPFSGNIWLVMLSQVISGSGQGLVFPLLMSLAVGTVAQERRATAMGFFQAIYGLGMFLGPWLGGIISDHFTINIGFFFMAALAAAGFALTLTLARRRQPARAASGGN
ncbi:MAG: MFS transporter [Clostridiales bacterium]|nr:MFS transporter [Clostridiales bacterium]